MSITDEDYGKKVKEIRLNRFHLIPKSNNTKVFLMKTYYRSKNAQPDGFGPNHNELVVDIVQFFPPILTQIKLSNSFGKLNPILGQAASMLNLNLSHQQ